MSSQKERHYWAQLRAALTAGQWRSPHPARTPNGQPIPWQELLRKFNKHCRGYADIAEVAAQTRALALLLGARYADDDEDLLLPGSSLAEVVELSVAEVGVLDLERMEEAMAGYETLKNLEESKFDTVHLTLAHYAFALRRPAECIAYLQKVPELLQIHSHIPTAPDSARTNGSLTASNYAPSTASFAGSFSSSAAIDVTTPEIRDGRVWAMTETMRSLCLEAMSLEILHPSDPQIALNAYRKALPLLSTLQDELGLSPYRSAAKPDLSLFSQIRELWRWMERLLWRAIVLSAKTCDVFVDAPAVESQESIPRTSSTSTVTPLSTPTATPGNSLWTWLNHYRICSVFWPPNFRSKHRSTVCAIHLRAFVLRFGQNSPPPRSSSSSLSSRTTSKSWRTEALTVVNSYRNVLTATTMFPKAGKRNVAVEEFVELVVALWEAGWVVNNGTGEGDSEDLGATWVIDILQWSQTLTFNSSRILRHLMRLLYISAMSPAAPCPVNRMLAKRTLQLYIQVVGKAWEASKEGVGEDMDGDARWVETLVFGARMLASDIARHFQMGGGITPHHAVAGGRSPVNSVTAHTHTAFASHFAGHSPASAAQLAQHPQVHFPVYTPVEDDEAQIAELHGAVSVLEKARLRLDVTNKKLLGDVHLATGIIWGLLAVIGQDPLERPAYFHKSHEALLCSIEANPTPSAYYHLALSFSRRIPSSAAAAPVVQVTPTTPLAEDGTVDPYKHVHSLPRALECAGLAVETRPTDVRYWHLLGLLLTAQENWAGAREVLERGAGLDSVGTEGRPQPARSEDSEGSDESDSEEGAETGEAFAVVGGNEDRPKMSSRGSPHTENLKHKRSVSTIMANGNEGASDPLPPTRCTVLSPTATSIPPAATILTYIHPSSNATASDNTSSYNEPDSYAFSFDEYPAPPSVIFERHLQLRMTLVALMEVMNGPEGAEEGWLDVFGWVAERQREMRGNNTPASTTASGGAKTSGPTAPVPVEQDKAAKMQSYSGLRAAATADALSAPQWARESHQSMEVPIGITILPATPDVDGLPRVGFGEQQTRIIVSEAYDEEGEDDQRGRKENGDGEKEKEGRRAGRGGKKGIQRASSFLEKENDKEGGDGVSTAAGAGGGSRLVPLVKRSMSSDRGGGKRSMSSDRSGATGDTSKSKKVQQMLKSRVDKGRAGISAVSRKIGHGVGKNGGLRRTNSTPDFHAVLQPTSYQASSIHSRQRLSSIIHSSDDRDGHTQTRTGTPVQGEWPGTPPQAHVPYTTQHRDFSTSSQSQASVSPSSVTAGATRNSYEDRMMSELWLMSAATFRRLGKIDQAKGAIQEAELRDETNPNVWVQLGLYYISLRLYQHAVDTLQKGRFIAPDDVSTTVHLARLYLDGAVTSKLHHTVNNTTLLVPVQPPLATTVSSPSVPQKDPTVADSSDYPDSLNPTDQCAPTPAACDIDLATGMLSHLTKRSGWDVPEAWYFLARAYALQGRREKEREALRTALELSESRSVRYVGNALGWSL